MSRSVLVVEDNEDLGGLYASILKAAGYSVEVCRDSDVAIQRSSEKDYAAVLIESSPAAGFRPFIDFLSVNRLDSLHTVVLATTENDVAMDQEWVSKGVFEMLHKPLTRERLRVSITGCTARHNRE